MSLFNNKLSKVPLGMLDQDVQDKFSGYDLSLADITQQFSHVVTIESYGIVNDGSVSDWQTAQNAITDAVTNGKTLVFDAVTYKWAKTLVIPAGTGSIIGKAGTTYHPKTQWQFLQTDNTDCVKYGTSGTGSSFPYVANLYIVGSANTGYGFNMDGSVLGGIGKPRIENVYIYAAGLRVYKVYLGQFTNVTAERWDGLQSGIIDSCGLIDLVSCSFNSSPTTQPSLTINNTNSVNAIGLNLDGNMGVMFTNSQNCYLYGYHEGSGTPVASQSQYAAWFDSQSRRNQVKFQTVSSVVDLGYDNKWETTMVSNQFQPINAKKVVNNIKNACFDQEALTGMNYGSSMSAVIDNTPGFFSGNSLKVTVPTGSNNFYVTPANNSVDQSYYVKLVAGQTYTFQFSISGDGDYPNVSRNDSFYVQAYYLYFDQSQGINYAILPIFKKNKLYQWSFTIPVGATITNSLSTIMFRFTNNTGSSRTVWLSDYIFTADIKTIMPNNLNATPTTGTWIINNTFPYSNNSGGLKCTDSGTFKTLSVATTANTTANSNTMVITSGNINDFSIGDFIDIANSVPTKYTRRITDINAATNTITFSSAFGYTVTNAAVTIHNPTFTTY